MVLINLSSNELRDPAKFTNTFSEGFVIKPNSYICLISASVVEDLTNASITIAAGAVMGVRYDAYNVFNAIINANETNYKLAVFVAHLNTLFGAFNYLGRRFHADLQSNADGDIVVAFQLYKVDDDATNYLRYIFPTNTLDGTQMPEQATNWLGGGFDGLVADPDAPGLVKGEVDEAFDNIMGLRPVGSVAGRSEVFLFDNKLTNTLSGSTQEYQLTNQPNHATISPLVYHNSSLGHVNLYTNDDWPWTSYTIANNVSTERGADPDTYYWELAAAQCNIDNATNTLIDGFDGNAPYNIVLTESGRMIGQLTDTAGNVDNVFDDFWTTGMQVRIGNVDCPTAPYNSIPYIHAYDYDGLAAWIPNQVAWTTGTGSTALTYNTRTILPYCGTNLLYRNVNAQSKAQFLDAWTSTATNRRGSSSAMGCWLSRGLNDRTYDAQTHCQYKDNGLNEAITDITYGGNASDFTKDIVLFQRVDTITPEPPTAISSKRNIIDIPSGHPGVGSSVFTGTGVNLVSFLFRLRNDNTIVTGAGQFSMCVMGGVQRDNTTKTPFIFLHPQSFTSGSVMDVTIHDSLGSPTNITLEDPTATRIDIAYDTWYYFAYQDNGVGGAASASCSITDLTTGTIFSKTLSPTNYGIPHITSIGGACRDNDVAFQGAENYMFGHIADFRLYSKPFRAGLAVADWDAKVAALRAGYYAGTFTSSFMEMPTLKEVYVNSETKYATIQQPSPDYESTNAPMVLANQVRSATDIPNGYYVIQDVFIAQNIKMNFANRDKTLAASAYTDKGNGLVNAASLNDEFDLPSYDAVNQRAIQEYVGNTQNGIQHPFFDELGEVNDLALDDEVFNVEVTNLPHRTLNGKNRSYDKTIYQLPVEQGLEKNNLKITEHSPASKVWIPLNNPGEIPCNQLDIQISKEDGKKADNLQPDTHISIQIETRDGIL